MEKEYKGGKLSQIIIDSLEPFFKKLSEKGIRDSVQDFLVDFNLDEFVLNKIKNQLTKLRIIEFNSVFLNRIYVQYRYDGIQIEPTGILRFLIKKITITNSQILKSFESILDQIEEKYVKSNDYILEKIDEIVVSLSNTDVYKPKNSQEKTLYDLAMLILFNYYNTKQEVPNWITLALDNISKGKFLSSWIKTLLDYISEIIAQVSENIFFNFKVTFDSLIVRTVLNKKTNKGQISSLLKLLNIDVKEIIYKFSKDYISPSFLRGASEILVELSNAFLSSVNRESGRSDKLISDFENMVPFNITVSIGKTLYKERSFRWYTGKSIEECFIEYSYDNNFKESIKLKSFCEVSSRMVPTINLGLISGYDIIEFNKHSICIKDLNPGNLYYRICCKDYVSETYTIKIDDYNEDFEFTVFTDSQGMVKQDYEAFSEVLEFAFKDDKSKFLVHLGDFVDDGNNEQFWTWVLNSKVWKENMCIPLNGNHEVQRRKLAIESNVENSITAHFNIQNLPIQDTSQGMYYSFEYGDVTFLVLNTNFKNSNIAMNDLQYNWAFNKLVNAKTKWKIIFAHKSPYSTGPHFNDLEIKKFRYQISKLVYFGKVDLVISGHDHVYVRTSILSFGKEVGCEKVVTHKCKDLKRTFVNPHGAIFVVPGTSGVKNYKQRLPALFPFEALPNINLPVYLKVCVNSSKICFKAYSFDLKSKKSKLFDSFEIEKKDENNHKLDYIKLSKLIKNLPDLPWLENSEKINELISKFNLLSYSEKVKVKDSKYLFRMSSLNDKYFDVISRQICTVQTKKEFLAAIKNPCIGTIITACDEIKFDDAFFGDNSIVLNRDICIRGCAKLSQISFVLKEKSMLILADSVCINNNRKLGSLYPSRDVFRLLDESSLIIRDNVSVNSSGGIGNNTAGINILGENCSVYLNSSSCNFVKGKFIKAVNCDSRIVINSGKYLSEVVVNGSLVVNGGFIRSIKGLENSDIKIYGGIIGEKDKFKYNIPIESWGKVRVNSGKIRAKDGVSILIHDSKDCFVNNTNSVDIEGKIIYN